MSTKYREKQNNKLLWSDGVEAAYSKLLKKKKKKNSWSLWQKSGVTLDYQVCIDNICVKGHMFMFNIHQF